MFIEKTNRGFKIGEFEDRNGNKCSIQESSIATEECIWLGINDANPQIMASRASAHGIKTSENCGWIEYPLHDEVSLTTRMHLNKEQAILIRDQLNNFIDKGEL